MTPVPKPPKRKTNRAHLALVAQLPCIICGARPVEVHHVIHGRISQRRGDDTDTLPLCYHHHRLLHDQQEYWRSVYGLDIDYLPRVAAQIAELKARTV